jgi:hypothetical protein
MKEDPTDWSVWLDGSLVSKSRTQYTSKGVNMALTIPSTATVIDLGERLPESWAFLHVLVKKVKTGKTKTFTYLVYGTGLEVDTKAKELYDKTIADGYEVVRAGTLCLDDVTNMQKALTEATALLGMQQGMLNMLREEHIGGPMVQADNNRLN